MKDIHNAITDELDRIARKYDDNNAEKVVNVVNQTIFYRFNLGAREVGIMFCPKEHLLCAGLKHGTARVTNRVEKEYKNLLRDLENDINEWRVEHPHCCNKLKGELNG